MKYKVLISTLIIISTTPIVFIVLTISSQVPLVWFISTQTIEGRDFIEQQFSWSKSTYKYHCEDFPEFAEIDIVLKEKGGQFPKFEAYLGRIKYSFRLELKAVERCPGKYEFVVYTRNKDERFGLMQVLEGHRLNGVPVNIVGI